jgi:hypothetical protein
MLLHIFWLSGVLSIQIGFTNSFQKGLSKSWKNKKEKDFLSPSLSRARPTSSPPPRGLLSLLPPFSSLLRPAPARPTLWPRRSSQRRTPLPFAAAADKAVPHPVPLPGGAHLSDLSSTSCPSRTRAEPQPHACFGRAVPTLSASGPLYTARSPAIA